ncbi:hypothetical protein EV127DRAFT_435309 [Xylaria flabelliformis]|nr:hypothetical protein EV127DRAFT_435309 [Xylaria flabelliformis]
MIRRLAFCRLSLSSIAGTPKSRSETCLLPLRPAKCQNAILNCETWRLLSPSILVAMRQSGSQCTVPKYGSMIYCPDMRSTLPQPPGRAVCHQSCLLRPSCGQPSAHSHGGQTGCTNPHHIAQTFWNNDVMRDSISCSFYWRHAPNLLDFDFSLSHNYCATYSSVDYSRYHTTTQVYTHTEQCVLS